MAQYEERIFTNDNCTGCNRCISTCTVPEANIARMENGHNKIYVDSQQCINCAKCIEVCPHGARDYRDDTDAFLDALAGGKQIAVLAAPAIRSNFPQHEKLLGLLRKMGAKYLFDTSFGADICTWGYIRYIQKSGAKGLISQPCPAIVNYVEKHDPILLPQLAPVHSPAMCAAIYMRKYKGIQEEIAFLSPCIAKKDEFADPNTGGIVQYNVTFRKLLEALQRRKIDYRSAPEGSFDSDQHGLGSIYPMPGGLKKNVHKVMPEAWVHQVEGQPEAHNFLDIYHELSRNSAETPLLIDALNCAKGCNLGTGAICSEKDILSVDRTMYREIRGVKESKKRSRGKNKGETPFFHRFDKELDLGLFMRKYTDKHVRREISGQQLENAYLQLRKETEESRRINCCSCGYETCEAMATVIAKGINHESNCVEYHKAVLRSQQQELEELMQKRGEVSRHLQDDVQMIFSALSENTEKSDETTSQVTQINEEVNGMLEIASRLQSMVDVLDKQLQQYLSMGTQIVSISTMTKLLSMNASVEAAHAKELGKGFSVVAEQMKLLSNESAESANEIISSNEQVMPLLEEVRGISETLNSQALRISSATEDILESMKAISEAEQKITETASQIISQSI